VSQPAFQEPDSLRIKRGASGVGLGEGQSKHAVQAETRQIRSRVAGEMAAQVFGQGVLVGDGIAGAQCDETGVVGLRIAGQITDAAEQNRRRRRRPADIERGGQVIPSSTSALMLLTP